MSHAVVAMCMTLKMMPFHYRSVMFLFPIFTRPFLPTTIIVPSCGSCVSNKTIATYVVPVPPLNTDGTRTQKSGTYLPDNISNLAISPDQKQLARITDSQNTATVNVSNTGGTSIKSIVRSPFQEWLLQWTPQNMYLQTKATASANGFLYTINQSSASLSRVFRGHPGLTTSISPSGTYILYSESTPTGFATKFLIQKQTALSISVWRSCLKNALGYR